MDGLIAGYRRFRAGTWRVERERFEELSRHGQHPRALVIACSDSRTDPQMVFNAAPGELFVIRNIANLAPPYGPDDQPHGVSSATPLHAGVMPNFGSFLRVYHRVGGCQTFFLRILVP